MTQEYLWRLWPSTRSPLLIRETAEVEGIIALEHGVRPKEAKGIGLVESS